MYVRAATTHTRKTGHGAWLVCFRYMNESPNRALPVLMLQEPSRWIATAPCKHLYICSFYIRTHSCVTLSVAYRLAHSLFFLHHSSVEWTFHMLHINLMKIPPDTNYYLLNLFAFSFSLLQSSGTKYTTGFWSHPCRVEIRMN